MPTSVGIAIMAGVVLMGLAMSAKNSGRIAVAVLLGVAAAAAVGWAVFDWSGYLNPQ